MADAVETRAVDTTGAPTEKRSRPYTARFAIAQVIVVAAFAGVLVFFAFLVARDANHGWSSYRPTGDGDLNRGQNLADYIAPRYTYGNNPIAVVQAQPLLYRDVAVDGIAFTQAPIRNVGTHFRQFEPSNSTMTYVFCGRATKCGMPEEGATDIFPLLQRESLELALYTFKYSPGVNKIVNLLPPTTDAEPAIYFKRGDLQKQLSRPLSETLPERNIVTPQSLGVIERARVQRLTADKIYPSSFQTLANGATLLLLGTSNGTDTGAEQQAPTP